MHIVEMSTSIPVNPVDNIHMAGEDRISELPVGILDNILGFLPIQEAARTVILSSSWKDIWFSLTKLNCCHGFFDYICPNYSDAEGWKSDSQSHIWEVINKILMQHNGSIQKIVFHFSEEVFTFHSSEEFELWDIAKLLSYNLNQWFLLLTQNGVEEIDISCFRETKCQVSNCLLSCPTLKGLKLENVDVEPINDYCILPNVTSLSLRLEISLLDCSPYYHKKFCVLPLNLDLRSISNFDLCCSPCCFEMFVKEHTRVGHAPALNFELLKLSVASCSFTPEYINNSAFIHLLRACAKLCELDIWHLEDLFDAIMDPPSPDDRAYQSYMPYGRNPYYPSPSQPYPPPQYYHNYPFPYPPTFPYPIPPPLIYYHEQAYVTQHFQPQRYPTHEMPPYYPPTHFDEPNHPNSENFASSDPSTRATRVCAGVGAHWNNSTPSHTRVDDVDRADTCAYSSTFPEPPLSPENNQTTLEQRLNDFIRETREENAKLKETITKEMLGEIQELRHETLSPLQTVESTLAKIMEMIQVQGETDVNAVTLRSGRALPEVVPPPHNLFRKKNQGWTMTRLPTRRTLNEHSKKNSEGKTYSHNPLEKERKSCKNHHLC
ncbi:uncharacterized protein LOC116024294 [Ipomoea triloba]|uniref:uncharacterized protein LOC116024294 n=1 Tax=Ipomoea triloba TaxID=35885 RepID=UPI00125D4107|nr:uncharacterized protein LOC116024294 [Ipomoea triloba]